MHDSKYVVDYQKQIGAGSDGRVYVARKKTGSQKDVAVKIVTIGDPNHGTSSTTMREVAAYADITSRNVLPLHMVEHDPGSGCFRQFFTLCPSDLGNYIWKYHHPTPSISQYFMAHDCIRMAHQLLNGLADIHRMGFIHRDLKPQNVLLEYNPEIDIPRPSDITLLIADFGLASRPDHSVKKGIDHETPNVVTQWYRDPVLLLTNSRHTTGIDLWSAGIVLLDVLFCTFLMSVQSSEPIEQFHRICQVLLPPSLREICLMHRDPVYPDDFDAINQQDLLSAIDLVESTYPRWTELNALSPQDLKNERISHLIQSYTKRVGDISKWGWTDRSLWAYIGVCVSLMEYAPTARLSAELAKAQMRELSMTIPAFQQRTPLPPDTLRDVMITPEPHISYQRSATKMDSA